VKRVLMPLEKKPVEAPKSNTTPSTTSTKTVQTPATGAPGEQRPRRITPWPKPLISFVSLLAPEFCYPAQVFLMFF